MHFPVIFTSLDGRCPSPPKSHRRHTQIRIDLETIIALPRAPIDGFFFASEGLSMGSLFGASLALSWRVRLREFVKCIRASSPIVTMNKAIPNQNITSSPTGLNSLYYHLLCPASLHICNAVCLYPERAIAVGVDTGMSSLFH
jgi:hypothetical protein